LGSRQFFPPHAIIARKPCNHQRLLVVGLAGFEPAASSSRTKRSTKLSHSPRVARGIFAEAVKDKFLDHSPVADLKEMKRDKPLRDTPSQEEFEAILETVGSQKDNRDAQDSVDFLKFMGLAGVGNSEAAALKWKHVNFELEEIRLYRSKTDIGFVITIYQAVRPLLDQLWERSDQKPESNVFRIKSARKALTNACKRLQLPHYTQRSLRRMFITKCIYLNIPPPTIGAWQGHSDNGQTILRYYGQLIARLNSDLAKRIT
jgi:integrase